MVARMLGTLIVLALMWGGAARGQAAGTPGAGGSTGTTGTGTGTGTTGSGGSTTSGTPGSAGGVTFDPVAAAAARLFGNYRVPGSAPLDTSGVYRVDTGSSPPAAGSGGSSAGSTGSTATTNSTSGPTTGGTTP